MRVTLFGLVSGAALLGDRGCADRVGEGLGQLCGAVPVE
jgi:hypothetical protein